MELIYKSESVIKSVSKNRPKSLIFRISRELYDILHFTHDTKVTVEVYVNDAGKKILKIYEKEWWLKRITKKYLSNRPKLNNIFFIVKPFSKYNSKY